MKTFTIKHDVNIEDLTEMTPYALILLGATVAYCYNHKLECNITSLKEEVTGRVSSSHRDGRAFDLSTKQWKLKDIEKLCNYTNGKYKTISAISASDLKPRACVYHKIEGSAYHLHLQVRPQP